MTRLEHVLRGAVAGEERDINAVLDPDVLESRHVAAVVAVTPVFILDLQHQHGSAARHQQRPHHCGEPRHVALGGGDVPRIHRSNPQVGVAQQVRRQSAKIPLGADIRAGAEEHPHPLVLRDADEARDVAVARREVEAALGLLVVIPEDVRRDGVEAHRLRHLDAVPPVLRRNARRVHLAGADLERLAVEEEVGGREGKRVARRAGCGAGGNGRVACGSGRVACGSGLVACGGGRGTRGGGSGGAGGRLRLPEGEGGERHEGGGDDRLHGTNVRRGARRSSGALAHGARRRKLRAPCPFASW